MSTKVKNQKPLVIAAIVFVVLVVAGVVIWQVTAPKGTAGAKAYTLTVVDADGKETVHNLNTDEEMLGAALQDAGLIEGEESEYGLFVTKVDGIEADSANQEWWCLTINGEMASTGVDSTPVEDGGKYEFTLTVGYCFALKTRGTQRHFGRADVCFAGGTCPFAKRGACLIAHGTVHPCARAIRGLYARRIRAA